MSGTPNAIYIVNLICVARLSQQNAESHFRHQRLRTRRVLSRLYSCERNRRPPAHTVFLTFDPLLPVSVMTELLEYYRRESMGEETGFAHSCKLVNEVRALGEPHGEMTEPGRREQKRWW